MVRINGSVLNCDLIPSKKAFRIHYFCTVTPSSFPNQPSSRRSISTFSFFNDGKRILIRGLKERHGSAWHKHEPYELFIVLSVLSSTLCLLLLFVFLANISWSLIRDYKIISPSIYVICPEKVGNLVKTEATEAIKQRDEKFSSTKS